MRIINSDTTAAHGHAGNLLGRSSDDLIVVSKGAVANPYDPST
jgi:hypothetical protein